MGNDRRHHHDGPQTGQEIADAIAGHLHAAHNLKDKALARGAEIGDLAPLDAFFLSLEASMAVGMVACASFGLNEGGK